MTTAAPPVIDFSPVYGNDVQARSELVDKIRKACASHGFFQLVNHGVPATLQGQIMEQAKYIFDLPLDVKDTYTQDDHGVPRGYERFRSQNFEKRGEGDLKEGFTFGRELPSSILPEVARKFFQGSNKYPVEVAKPEQLRDTIVTYHQTLTALAHEILKVLAEGLDLDPMWFSNFAKDPIATLRLLHYPPQAPDASALERGIGAHTDFGAITILLQDMNGGLQIWDRATSTWVDVTPIQGAYVVNLGNLMMRWTNDKYLSNLHRVINKTGKERYSIPFFFSGNPDFLVECLPTCKTGAEEAKYPPILVHDWMGGRYADTYVASKGKAVAGLSTGAEAAAALS